MVRRFGGVAWLAPDPGRLSTNTYSRNEMFVLGAAFSPGLHSAGQSAARAGYDGLTRRAPMAAVMRARPGGAALAMPGRRVGYPVKGVSGPAAAEIASFCSVAAGGCPVASCSCWSRSRLTRCKPAMALARAAGSSGIRAHAAHSSNSGESRLAVRRPIASCMELATVRPSSPAGSGGRVGPRILRARGRQRRPPGGFVMSSFGRSGSARRLGPVPVPGPRWPESARAAPGSAQARRRLPAAAGGGPG